MHTIKISFLTVLFVLVTACGEGPSVSSGAGSDSVCDRCTDIVITNNTNDPIVVSGSGRNELLFPNQILTFKYGKFDFAKNIELFARKSDTAGRAIGPAVKESFFLFGGTQSWLVEPRLFD